MGRLLKLVEEANCISKEIIVENEIELLPRQEVENCEEFDDDDEEIDDDDEEIDDDDDEGFDDEFEDGDSRFEIEDLIGDYDEEDRSYTDDEIDEMFETDGSIMEKMKVIVIRRGKRVVKWKAKPGYKMQGGKEVRMTPLERRMRVKGARRSARTRRSKSNTAAMRSRMKSMMKRRTLRM